MRAIEGCLAATVLLASLQPLLSAGGYIALPAWLPVAITAVALAVLVPIRRLRPVRAAPTRDAAESGLAPLMRVRQAEAPVSCQQQPRNVLEATVEQAQAASLTLPAVAHRFGGVLDRLSQHVALWISDPASGQVLYVSEGYARVWQRSLDSLYQDGSSYREQVHPDDRAQLEAWQSGEWAQVCDFRLCLDNGEQRDVRLELHHVQDELSGACFAVFMAFDVTDFAGRERQLKHALEHLAKTNIRLLRSSRKDSLTGVYNRQYMNEALNQAFRQFKRYRTPLTLVFIDLAKFKQVNDSFGHGVGDSLLKAVAKRLKTSVRESDMVARYGGDEFVMLLQHADEAVAWQVVSKLSKRPIVVQLEGAAPVVAQFDAGVAELSIRHASVADWLEEVDRSMYASKRRALMPSQQTPQYVAEL